VLRTRSGGQDRPGAAASSGGSTAIVLSTCVIPGASAAARSA